MFEFTDDCIIGIDQIDKEHQYLFELINNAYTLLNTDYHNDLYNEIKEIIEDLEHYADQHFNHEEDYMLQICDPELIRQRAQHSVFRDRISEFEFINIDQEDQQQEVLTDLLRFLAKWLYRHILGSDIMIGKLPPLDEWLLRENPCEFTEEYMTGVELIDKEHEELFTIVDQANHLAKTYKDTDYDRLVAIINRLKEYTKEHFADEEEYMESIHYEGLNAQRRAHSAFIDKLDSIDLRELDDNPQEQLQELVEFLLGWLINHILNSDKKIPLHIE